jgi:hypothetical protein
MHGVRASGHSSTNEEADCGDIGDMEGIKKAEKKRTRYGSRRPQTEAEIGTDAKHASKKKKRTVKGGTGVALGSHQPGDGDAGEIEQEDHNDWICGVCCLSEAFDGSDLMLCDGPCLRSFHIGCLEKSKDLVSFTARQIN